MAAENAADGQFGAAVEELAGFFDTHGFTVMGSESLKSEGLTAFAGGWKKKLQFENGQNFTLAVLVKNDFPVFPPRLAVLDGPPLLSWPHLEPAGLLCVFPSDAAFDVQDPVGQAAGLLNEGIQLIERILSGAAEQDFKDELVSYWGHSVEGAPRKFVSLLDATGGHRTIHIWRGKQQYLVADSEEAARNWLIRRYGQRKNGEPHQIGTALFLKATDVPLPAQYPQNAADVRALFASDNVALNLIATQALGDQDREVVVAFACPTGMALAPITITPSQQLKIPGRKAPDFMTKGFRQGHVPPNIAAMRSATPMSRVTRHTLDRADHGWIHGRDHDPRQKVLKTKKVLMVGCGSLGSTVAELLAKGGVGSLGLIDGQVLEWANISRHMLGAEDIGSLKAESLAKTLSKAFPHLSSVKAIEGKLGPLSVPVLQGWDLVIGTTGIWQIDALINERHVAGDFPLALYGWLEPHAAATHTVTVPRGGACLRCNFTKTGTPHLVFSSWPNDGLVPVPACGGSFSPYGAADLAFAHGLVADEAIAALVAPIADSREAIWVGKTSRLELEGGLVSEQWQQVIGNPGEGGFLTSRAWPRAQGCTVCGKVAAEAA